MNNTIDITGLDKERVLRALWENSKTAAFFQNFPQLVPAYDEAKAKRAIEDGYADYLCGRVIKTRLDVDALDPWGYDRDNGAGKMKEVIDGLRRSVS